MSIFTILDQIHNQWSKCTFCFLNCLGIQYTYNVYNSSFNKSRLFNL